jgi:serine beta-lactamase-like protein LACTB, mitochondrial
MYRMRLSIAAVLAMFITNYQAQASKINDQAAALVSNKIITELVKTNGVPGMGAAIWRGGKIIWTGSAGFRDAEKKLLVDGDTIFRLASVSKLITAAAAARLSQDSLLDIDAPVASIVTGLPSTWNLITTRQLAAHISGLPHYQDIDASRGNTHYANVKSAVDVFKGRDLLFAPGTSYSYSSWGYTLLSAVVEKRAGMPFLDYVAKYITRDLEIVPDATDSSNPVASKAYEFENGQIKPAARHDYSYTWGGGGFGASPQAIATFGGQILQGQIISRETFAWMQQPAKLGNGLSANESNYQVGFGWRISENQDRERYLHHAGVTIGARSSLSLWPDRNMSISLLSNALWVSSIEQTAEMIAAPFHSIPAGLTPGQCPIGSSRYSGRFGDEKIAGSARFLLENGLCIGEISVGNAFGAFLNDFPQRDAATLKMIGFTGAGGFSRAALVTPIGVFDLRHQAQGGYVARLSTKRSLTLTFDTPANVKQPEL